jgi:hypothetical protein
MSVRIRFLQNYEGHARGETRILRDDDAQALIASGIADVVNELKPAGPQQTKPVNPTEVKQEFGGKKKVKTPKS